MSARKRIRKHARQRQARLQTGKRILNPTPKNATSISNSAEAGDRPQRTLTREEQEQQRENSLPPWFDLLAARDRGVKPPESFTPEDDVADCLNQMRGHRTSIILAALARRCEYFQEEEPEGCRGWNQNIALMGYFSLAQEAMWNMLGVRQMFELPTRAHFEK